MTLLLIAVAVIVILVVVIVWLLQANRRLKDSQSAAAIAPQMGDSRVAKVTDIDAQYGVVLDSIAEAIIVTDETGVIRTANTVSEELLHETEGALTGLPASGILNLEINGDIVAQSEHPVTQVLSSHKAYALNRYNKHKLFVKRSDGSSFRCELQVSPVIVDSSLKAIVLTLNDLTEFDRIDKAKGEFVSLASHQLRTPLNVASWYVEKLMMQKKGPLNVKQVEYANQIYQNNQRMISLVGDLLNASRVDLGKVNVKKEEVDLLKLADALQREIHIAMEEKKINFTYDFPSTPIIYKDGDISITTVIIQNLLSNAMKYTNTGGTVTFTIKIVGTGTQLNPIKPFMTKREGVLVSVADTGVGIPKADQEKIFSKLFRATNTDELDVKGTGLGLYVTQSFAIALNGDIWFESVEGEGTTFSVYWPFPTPLIHKSSVRHKVGEEPEESQADNNASANTPPSDTVNTLQAKT